MQMRVMGMGIIDLLGGLILFAQASWLIKLVAIALITKGAMSVISSFQH